MGNIERFLVAAGITLSLVLSIVSSTSSHAEHLAMAVLAPQVGIPRESHRPTEQRKPMALLGIGPRYGVGGDSPLGEEQKEDFRLYDVAAMLRLPWGWQHRSTGWGLETRFIASAGELAAAGQTSFMSTLVPLLALTSPNSIVAIDAGIGPGFFSNYKFGVQNFGGPVQIVGTAGIGFTLFSGFHAGYRFQHFSDAGMYGPTSLGVDMHIMDIRYKF
jgi:hypothetical protein